MTVDGRAKDQVFSSPFTLLIHIPQLDPTMLANPASALG